MSPASSKIVYVTERAEDFGWLVTGPGCAPLEYLEHTEMLATRLAACKTVGDVRQLPEELARVSVHLEAGAEVEFRDEWLAVLEIAAEPGDYIDAAELPDALALWPGWSDPAFESVEYAHRSFLPWEAGTPFAYETWMPESVIALADFQELTSPMQETARWSFKSVSIDNLVRAFEDAGWEVRRDDEALGKHLVLW